MRGLRGRLLAALVLTSAVTLAVAAATLLPPLQRRLQHEEVTSLKDTARASRTSFSELSDYALYARGPRLLAQARALERRTGARVAVFDDKGRKLVDTGHGPFGPVPETRDDARPHSRVVVGGQSADVARVSVPIKVGGRGAVIALVKPLDDVGAAARDVRVAFTEAALAGFGIALLLGIGLSGTLLRRLRRLRGAALEVADHGLGADVPADGSSDEVGDLGRAFARMQNRLRHQEDARRNFVATASHEMRTPLASLQGMLELLEEDLRTHPPDLPDAVLQAGRAQDQAQRLNRLASDLLDLTRLDAEVELRSEPVELNELCRAVVAEFEIRVGAERIELLHDDDDARCWATADPGSVARVIRILLDNALRYSPDGELVTVAAQAPVGGAPTTISVRDRGPGVPAEEHELIFDRFRRGSNAEAQRGFGLGLAIGRELARRMGGDLVLARDEGPGALFELRLPPAPAASVEDDREGLAAGGVPA